MIDKPQIIKGGHFRDYRGEMRFVNDFKFEDVKRFYFIKHPDTEIVRAWQGHQREYKYFYPIKGSFIIAWVKIDNFESPSINLKADFHIIKEDKSELVYIPPGYANGIKALEPGSELMIFSDMELEQSVNEKHRYNPDLWFDWNKDYTK